MIIRLTPGVWVSELSAALATETDDRGFVTRALLAPHSDTCFGWKVDDRIVSFSSVRFSSRSRKNAWGRYLDWHLAYTPTPLRRKHYATNLWLAVREEAIASQHDRVKSIAKGKLGFYLHRSLGHQFWGWDKGGRGLIVDSPLTTATFPQGIPIEARCAKDANLLGAEELNTALTQLL